MNSSKKNHHKKSIEIKNRLKGNRSPNKNMYKDGRPKT